MGYICKVLGIGVLMSLSIHSFSQETLTAENFLKYANSSKNNTSHHFYILELNNNTPREIIHRTNLTAIRKLSQTQYVVEESFTKLANERKFYKHLLPANNSWKLSPGLERLVAGGKNYDSVFRFTIAEKNDEIIKDHENNNFLNHIPVLNDQRIISVLCTFQQILDVFINDDNVLFIDVLTTKPVEELATKGFDLSANKINQIHYHYPLINGATQNVSIKEQFYDTTDIDLKNRLQYSPLASNITTNHANFIATIIAGGGNSVYYAKGVAWGAGVSSSSFEQVLPDKSGYYTQKNITVQNHSYGTAIDNSYGVNAAAFDKSANENPNLLHVLSSGNYGTATDTVGNFSTAPGFANLTGNFKMAKNVLVVGAADSLGIVAPLSSRGPAYDGRLKPELVAFEKNGTSEAAALVSGTALLLQQFYKSKNNVDLPSALAKAIIINSADDVNLPGPDYASGFGNVNGIMAMNTIKENNIFTGRIAHDSTDSFTINVPSNTSKLKVTLVWNDEAATAFAPKALVNDLDLEVAVPSTNKTWKPWVLSSFPSIDSLNALPERKRDSLNNVEQVTLENPSAGNYIIKITGYDIATANQEYYVVYSMDTINSFQWYFPSGIDLTEAGKETTLRWESTFSGSGKIEYNLPPGDTWIPVSQNVALSKKYFIWTVPDTITPCLLRMNIGSNYFYSDTFLITSLLNPKVGFVCGDSILLYWERLKNINEYQLYQLAEKYMEPFTTVSDTSVLLHGIGRTSKYFSVAPVFANGSAGTKSYTFDYTLQGTGCYIKTFFVDQDGSSAKLALALGAINNVDSISFEKLNSSGFIPIFSQPINGLMDFVFTYQPLTKGINIFRAKITLSDGQVIYSANEPIYYVEGGKYLVFPVPANKNSDIEIFTPIPEEEIIQVIDILGRIVVQKEIQFPHEFIKTYVLQPGQYFYRIIKKGIKVSSGKILIL